MQINKHLVGEVRKVGGGGHRFVGGKTWESGGDVAGVYSTTRVTVVWWWEAAKGRRRSAAMANLIRWETRWTELAVCVYQRGSKMIWSAIPTWREVPSLPVCSLHVGTSVGAPTILLGSKICRLGIRNAGMSLKNSQCTNNPIERPIENTDGDALSCLPPHIYMPLSENSLSLPLAEWHKSARLICRNKTAPTPLPNPDSEVIDAG
jgi:hypothetical protein